MIKSELLSKYKTIRHGILERDDGLFRYFKRDKIEKILKKEGFTNPKLVFMDQVHGIEIFKAGKGHGNIIKLGVDGLYTGCHNKTLFIKTADCIPVLIYNPKKKLVGAIHAGRAGIKKGILEEAVKKLGKDSIFYLGPHIMDCCYFMRGDMKAPKKYITKKGNKEYLSITKMAIDKLIALGVDENKIETSNICTKCSKLPSHRRQDIKKHIASFIGFK